MARPLKFKTKEDLQGAKDGLVEFPVELLRSSEFGKEKDLEQFIVLNIEKFTRDFLQDDVVSFEVNKPIAVQRFISPRGRRIDLVIVGKNKTYLIELKNPLSGTESRASIGQILDYGREYLDPKKELLIITTKFDMNTAETIRFYNLPIRYIYLDKKRIMELYD